MLLLFTPQKREILQPIKASIINIKIFFLLDITSFLYNYFSFLNNINKKIIHSTMKSTNTDTIKTTKSNNEYENTEIDGSQALKVVLGMNTGKYCGGHVYYTNTTVLTNKNQIN